MTHRLPRLHAVTNDRILELPDLFDRARALSHAGNVAVHVRGVGVSARRRTEVATELIALGLYVFINDRADIARIVGAQGVHLPEAGLGITAARELLPLGVVGRSTHTPRQARDAMDAGADYVFLGPIWHTQSHPNREPLGVRAITAARPARVIAIGGVTPERAVTCLQAGAYGIAAITALWDAPDTAAAATDMLVSLEASSTEREA